MTLSKIIELRPHHAICIQHFVGKGYSKEFTQNMYSTISELELNNPLVKLVSKCDVICGVCPNRIGNNCENEAKIQLLDIGTLDKCYLEIGQELSWEDLKGSVRKNIIDKNLLQDVCHSCEWISFCEKVK